MMQMKNNDSLEQDVSDGDEAIWFQLCLENQVHRIACGGRENREDEARGPHLATSSFLLLTNWISKSSPGRFNEMLEDHEGLSKHTEPYSIRETALSPVGSCIDESILIQGVEAQTQGI